MFADEPTGSLDSVGADEIMELLVEAAKKQATAVLVVTHEPRVAGFADRTVLMRDGVESLQVQAATAELPVGSDSMRVAATSLEASDDVISWSGRRGRREAE